MSKLSDTKSFKT